MTDQQREALRTWLAAAVAAKDAQAEVERTRTLCNIAQAHERNALDALNEAIVVDADRPERLVSIDGQTVMFRWERHTGVGVRVVEVEVA